MPDTATKPLDGLLEGFERELAGGDAATYRRLLREDAVVIVPGRALDKAATMREIDEAGGWGGFDLADEREELLGPDTALITYRFTGHRGVFEYEARLSSVYTRDAEGDWRLLLHQQTPLG